MAGTSAFVRVAELTFQSLALPGQSGLAAGTKNVVTSGVVHFFKAHHIGAPTDMSWETAVNHWEASLSSGLSEPLLSVTVLQLFWPWSFGSSFIPGLNPLFNPL